MPASCPDPAWFSYRQGWSANGRVPARMPRNSFFLGSYLHEFEHSVSDGTTGGAGH